MTDFTIYDENTAWELLQGTVEAMRAEAGKNGLTDEALADLLRDER